MLAPLVRYGGLLLLNASLAPVPPTPSPNLDQRSAAYSAILTRRPRLFFSLRGGRGAHACAGVVGAQRHAGLPGPGSPGRRCVCVLGVGGGGLGCCSC